MCFFEGDSGSDKCDEDKEFSYKVGDSDHGDCPEVSYGLRLKTLEPEDDSETAETDTTKIQGGTGSSPTVYTDSNFPANMPVSYDGKVLTFKPRDNDVPGTYTYEIILYYGSGDDDNETYDFDFVVQDPGVYDWEIFVGSSEKAEHTMDWKAYSKEILDIDSVGALSSTASDLGHILISAVQNAAVEYDAPE